MKVWEEINYYKEKQNKKEKKKKRKTQKERERERKKPITIIFIVKSIVRYLLKDKYLYLKKRK